MFHEPPLQLVSSGVAVLWGLSPNGATAEYSGQIVGETTDLWIASTAAASSGTQLLAGTSVEMALVPIGNSNFTTDSSHVLFFSTYSPSAFGGTLESAPVTATGSAQVIALGTSVNRVLAATDAKVVFCANGDAEGACDVMFIDDAAVGQ